MTTAMMVAMEALRWVRCLGKHVHRQGESTTGGDGRSEFCVVCAAVHQ